MSETKALCRLLKVTNPAGRSFEEASSSVYAARVGLGRPQNSGNMIACAPHVANGAGLSDSDPGTAEGGFRDSGRRVYYERRVVCSARLTDCGGRHSSGLTAIPRSRKRLAQGCSAGSAFAADLGNGSCIPVRACWGSGRHGHA